MEEENKNVETDSETTTIKKVGFFTDENGFFSMRRLLAFLSCIASLVFVGVCIFVKTDWKLALVCCGLPFGASIIFMFFTSWESIAKVAEAIKK